MKEKSNTESDLPRGEVLAVLLVVKEMREAQMHFFRTRDPLDLRTAKDLEKKVDNMIKMYVND